MVGIKAGPVKRALQEGIGVQPTISFHDTVVNVDAQKQEDAEAAVAVARRYDPLHLKEEVLAPSSMSAIHPVLRVLAQEVASQKQEMSLFKWDLAPPSKSKNLLWRDPGGGPEVLMVWPA